MGGLAIDIHGRTCLDDKRSSLVTVLLVASAHVVDTFLDQKVDLCVLVGRNGVELAFARLADPVASLEREVAGGHHLVDRQGLSLGHVERVRRHAARRNCRACRNRRHYRYRCYLHVELTSYRKRICVPRT